MAVFAGRVHTHIHTAVVVEVVAVVALFESVLHKVVSALSVHTVDAGVGADIVSIIALLNQRRIHRRSSHNRVAAGGDVAVGSAVVAVDGVVVIALLHSFPDVAIWTTGVSARVQTIIGVVVIGVVAFFVSISVHPNDSIPADRIAAVVQAVVVVDSVGVVTLLNEGRVG